MWQYYVCNGKSLENRFYQKSSVDLFPKKKYLFGIHQQCYFGFKVTLNGTYAATATLEGTPIQSSKQSLLACYKRLTW